MWKTRTLQTQTAKRKEVMRISILYAILLLVTLFFIGCESMQNYNACMNDPTCNEIVRNVQQDVSNSTMRTMDTVPSTTAVGVSVGGLIGAVISFLVGVRKGKTIRKGK